MVRYAWIVFGAAACGSAIATLLGGASILALVLTLGALVAACSVTVFSRIGRPRAEAHPIDRERLIRQRIAHGQLDDKLISQIDEIIGEREIDWLTRQDFASAWRDTPVSSLRDLRRLHGLATAPFDDELRDIVVRLGAANAEFLRYYELTTRPDPLLAAPDWREIDPDSTEDSQERMQHHLVELATAVARAYIALVAFRDNARRLPSARTPARDMSGS